MENLTSPIIGVISDTHDQVHHLIRVIDFFNREHVDMVVHCGDWISPFTFIHYTRLKAPLYGVFGNNDGDEYRILMYAEKFGLNVSFEKQLMVFSRYGKRIAVYHGEYEGIVKALIKCGDYDVVFHGHNHCPQVEKVGGVVSLNPGTLMDFTDEQTQGASIGLYYPHIHEGKIIRLGEL